MKNQQVSVNILLMLKTALIYLGLAVSGWMLLRLIQACIWLPNYLRQQEDEENKASRGESDEEYLLLPDEKKNV